MMDTFEERERGVNYRMGAIVSSSVYVKKKTAKVRHFISVRFVLIFRYPAMKNGSLSY